ncbi:YbaB/EbfC family nucleoid-associated protein [Propionicicella superfundia]|uniref:YbaB/EbfC family nucleoid-associated protein n=1 Tax=Propionicicella superfundia TaxID=348582 RepID=UPI001FE0943F|nr:YbaB/EbfC family nucleoid-associated protein [Propionicicella superfundia]
MQGLMAQAQAMQAQMMQAQEELTALRVTGTAGGGLVEVEVSGTGELTGVTISPEAWDPDDTEALGDLIVAAFRDAHGRASQVASAKMPSVPNLGI